jgi:TolB-like protein
MKAVMIVCLRMIASFDWRLIYSLWNTRGLSDSLNLPFGILCFSFRIKETDRRGDKLIYTFDRFSLDADRRELRRGRDLIAIEPQVFDVLQHLIAHRDRVVSNDNLIEAIWQGRIVSEATVSTRMNAVRRAIDDSGEQQRFIRTIARKGYRFVGDVVEQDAGAATGPVASAVDRSDIASRPLSLPDKPSIAVLPFTNISGDPEQEYFADGITEDITTALSQFRWLFVIARNSSFVFKGKSVDAKQIARALGVRYLLEGSVRKAGNRLRITGQLIDASSGAHLWADRFDGAVDDVFDLQDKVTASVVGAIGPKLEQAEISRAKRKPTENLDAYDYYLRGMASLHQGSKESTDEALRLFSRAIELDSDFASAFGVAAFCYDLRKWNSWMVDPKKETAEAERLARRAIALGKDDAVALCTGGFALVHVARDLDYGSACIDRALLANPNLASAWYFGGWASACLGEPEAGIEKLKRAMRLNPLDLFPFSIELALSWAHFMAGHYEEAVTLGRRAIRQQPNFQPGLRVFAVACVKAGKLEEGRAAIARMLELNPAFRVSNIKDVMTLLRPEDLAAYEDALRVAGLPD